MDRRMLDKTGRDGLLRRSSVSGVMVSPAGSVRPSSGVSSHRPVSAVSGKFLWQIFVFLWQYLFLDIIKREKVPLNIQTIQLNLDTFQRNEKRRSSPKKCGPRSVEKNSLKAASSDKEFHISKSLNQKSKKQTGKKFGFVVSENVLKDSKDYELYFNKKQERKRFSKMKIFEDFNYSAQRKLKEDKSGQNRTSPELDSRNSVTIVLPPCTNYQCSTKDSHSTTE